MPHITAATITFPTFPAAHEEIAFEWISAPDNERLIATRAYGKEFLLLVKQKEGQFLLKSDKLSRVSQNLITKEAILALSKALNADVLSTNIARLESVHLQKEEPYLKDIRFFVDSFPAHQKIAIEIGFGSARHLLYQAKQNPDTLYIGIEIHKPSIEQAMKQIKIQELENIFILDFDARVFLEFVPSNRVDAIFVHFPVPWDKQVRKRIFSKNFIGLAKRVLKQEGVLELRTDSENYFSYALGLVLDEAMLDMHLQKNLDNAISSKYEDRWKRQNKNIYNLVLKNLEISDDLPKKDKLAFSCAFSYEQMVAKFSTKAWVYPEYFLHLEKLFKIDEEGWLLRLSMGSFDSVLHTYVLNYGGVMRYYPREPIASYQNQLAHNKLKEILYGE